MQQRESRFASILPGSIRNGDARDSVDEVAPQWVASPKGESDALTCIRTAIEERHTVICAGGGTSLTVGNPPRSFDVALQTRNLDQVVEHRAEDMTVTVQAGITVQALATVLMSSGQRIAWDPDEPELATVGGVLASNSTGGHSYGFGQPRDLVLGMTVVDGHGRVLRLGGRVVKNVAGYDLVRLFAGSHGSLGMITEATLRTHPLPEAGLTVRVRFRDADGLEEARKALFASSLPLAAFDLAVTTSTLTAWTLWLRLEGSHREIEAQRDRIRNLCRGAIEEDGGAWRSTVHAYGDVVVRVGVAPADTVAFTHELLSTSRTPLRVGGRLGDGTLRVCAQRTRLDDETSFVDHVRATAHHHAGTAVLERVSATLKRARRVWDDGAAPVALMREIKSRFDPYATFAPGRFVGEL